MLWKIIKRKLSLFFFQESYLTIIYIALISQSVKLEHKIRTLNVEGIYWVYVGFFEGICCLSMTGFRLFRDIFLMELYSLASFI